MHGVLKELAGTGSRGVDCVEAGVPRAEKGRKRAIVVGMKEVPAFRRIQLDSGAIEVDGLSRCHGSKECEALQGRARHDRTIKQSKRANGANGWVVKRTKGQPRQRVVDLGQIWALRPSACLPIGLESTFAVRSHDCHNKSGALPVGKSIAGKKYVNREILNGQQRHIMVYVHVWCKAGGPSATPAHSRARHRGLRLIKQNFSKFCI